MAAPYSPLLSQSRLRVLQDALYILDLELCRLEVLLRRGQVQQQDYDDCIAAIERDKEHARSEIALLTEIKIGEVA